MPSTDSDAGRISRVLLLKDKMRRGARFYTAFVVLCALAGVLLLATRNMRSYGVSFQGSTMRRSVRVSELLNAGIHLLASAGEAVVEYRDVSAQEKQVKSLTKEGKKEFVTQADLKSHIIIKETLLDYFPGLNIVSEEHDPVGNSDHEKKYFDPQLSGQLMDITMVSRDQKYSTSDVVIWIDPLDATQEYTEMLDRYVTIMMCIVVDGHPTASVIHFPFSKETYWQWSNHGAAKSFETLQATRGKGDPRVQRVVVSRSHAGEVNKTLRSINDEFEVIPAGGAGYKVFELLRGNAEAYVHTTAIKKWDICVGDAFLRHTGGDMRSLRTGRRISYGDPADYKVTGGFVAVPKKASGEELFLALRAKLGFD